MGNQALRRYRLFPFVIIHHKTNLLLQKGESLKITTSGKSVLEPEEYFLKSSSKDSISPYPISSDNS